MASPGRGVSVERAYYVDRSCGLLGCSHSVRPWTATRVEMDTGRSDTRYCHMLEIVMGKGEIPEKGGNYYDAETVARYLSERTRT